MSAISPSLLDALRSTLGDGGVIEDARERSGYEIGARTECGRAALVLRPRTTAQVAEVMRLCRQHAVAVVPQGANTGLVNASTPDGSGDQIVVSLERLQDPLEIDLANRSVRVGAGMRLSALNAALEPHGLFLPIDLGADPTIGGMVSTNTGGARFLRYGDMRRQVLGLRVVLGDGRDVRLGSGLRKDNTGLDLRQMLIGAGGALGVVTEVELEVQPMPRQSAAALILLNDAGGSVPLLGHFERQAGEMLAAFEGMSRAAVERAVAHTPGLKNPFAGLEASYAVLVELATSQAPQDGAVDLDQLLERCLAGWWESGDPATIDMLIGRPEQLWALRHAISEGLRRSGHVVGLDLSFRRGDWARFRAHMEPQLAAAFPEFDLCDFGHIGDGGVHFNLVATEFDPVRAHQLRAHVYSVAVTEFGGSFSAEHGLGRANLTAYRNYVATDVRTLAGRVQDAFSDQALGAIDFAALAAGPARSEPFLTTP